MGLISRMRRQNAVYWPPDNVDGYGRTTHGAPVALTLRGADNYRVRWEGKAEQFVAADGTTQVTNAVVYVPQLPDGSEVAVGGYLYLGEVAALVDQAVAENNAGAMPVKRFDTLPNLKASELLRVAYL